MQQSTPFYRFIDLVTCDQALVQCEKQKIALHKQVSTLTEKKKETQNIFAAAQKKLHDAQKERGVLDLQLSTLQTQKKKIENRLESVSSPREYQSLQLEANTCQETLEKTEELLIAQWDVIEQGERTFAQAQTVFTTTMESYNKHEQELHEQERMLETEQARLHTLRNGMEDGLPPEWITQYETLRKTITNPAVEVTNNICGGCFYIVPANLVASLKRHILIPCPNCRRILYQV